MFSVLLCSVNCMDLMCKICTANPSAIHAIKTGLIYIYRKDCKGLQPIADMDMDRIGDKVDQDENEDEDDDREVDDLDAI